ncbi:hypothetical protein [Streptomyces sp. NBC_00198]|uniref:hypothetical protein n=1 Tax=Streptomyces sp. NBC_00198 TaxID=2975677 RepID=UPI0022529886|nr:hypothetical protein [Streptomyces sp. NBC_00198]MCX5285694.1 hypothetical protein [Streptomyces sp. NBC_00198]MCX5286204.1 hypothetical protein [Streptomyces sp. NBC_00198]
MERVTLPSGAWVELRDPTTLRRGDKKRALKLVPVSEDEGLSLGMQHEMADGILAIMITGWSYELPLPPTAASLDLLPIEDGEALEQNTTLVAAHKLLYPERVEKTPEAVADPASPTEPSAE